MIVWFPHSDQRTFSRRPALVVQADGLDTGIDQILIALITTNLKRIGHPSRVFIDLTSTDGKASGLFSDSVIVADNLATVLTKAIQSVIGSLPDMTAVDEALRHTLGL